MIPDQESRFFLAFAKKKRIYAVPNPLAPIADTHAHLLCFWDKDPVEVLVRAACAGVRQMTTIWDAAADACDARAYADQLAAWVASARDLLAQSIEDGSAHVLPFASGRELDDPFELFGNVAFLAGVHPYGAPDYDVAVHARFLEALDQPLCIGVGEIGLDYHFDADDGIEAAPHDLQMEVMARQLEVAVARDVPVELHLRNDCDDEARAAHADALTVLDRVGIPSAGCVLHCFGEDRATMEQFLERGCHIAFGGSATFKRNDAVREAFAACPIDRLLFETDCPYMAPEPVRGLECEPAMMPWTVGALASDRSSRTGEGPRDIAYAVWRNSTQLFGGRR